MEIGNPITIKLDPQKPLRYAVFGFLIGQKSKITNICLDEKNEPRQYGIELVTGNTIYLFPTEIEKI